MSDGESASQSGVRPSTSEDSPKDRASGVGIPGGGLAASQWPASVAQGIDDVLATVHDRAIRPLILVSRAVVFGILIATMALVLGILLSVAVVRVLTVYAFGQRVWPAEALVGLLFAGGGIAAWTKRGSGQAKDA